MMQKLFIVKSVPLSKIMLATSIFCFGDIMGDGRLFGSPIEATEGNDGPRGDLPPSSAPGDNQEESDSDGANGALPSLGDEGPAMTLLPELAPQDNESSGSPTPPEETIEAMPVSTTLEEVDVEFDAQVPDPTSSGNEGRRYKGRFKGRGPANLLPEVVVMGDQGAEGGMMKIEPMTQGE